MAIVNAIFRQDQDSFQQLYHITQFRNVNHLNSTCPKSPFLILSLGNREWRMEYEIMPETKVKFSDPKCERFYTSLRFKISYLEPPNSATAVQLGHFSKMINWDPPIMGPSPGPLSVWSLEEGMPFCSSPVLKGTPFYNFCKFTV